MQRSSGNALFAIIARPLKSVLWAAQWSYIKLPPICHFFMIYIYRRGTSRSWIFLLLGKVKFLHQMFLTCWGSIKNISTCCCAIRLLFLTSLDNEFSEVTSIYSIICDNEDFEHSCVSIFILLSCYLENLFNLSVCILC